MKELLWFAALLAFAGTVSSQAPPQPVTVCPAGGVLNQNCQWSDWSVAIACSVRCGHGKRLLVRTVQFPACGTGTQCSGSPFKTEECDTRKKCLSTVVHDFCQDRRNGLEGLGHCSEVYVRCRRGRGRLHECRDGHRFDNIRKFCRHPRHILGCEEEVERCRGRENGRHKIGECKEDYLHCFDGRSRIRRCRRGHVFDGRFRGCAPKSFVAECRIEDRGCVGFRGRILEGKHPINRHTCHRWYKVCTNGHAVVAQCPPRAPAFNPRRRHCQRHHQCERELRRDWDDDDFDDRSWSNEDFDDRSFSRSSESASRPSSRERDRHNRRDRDREDFDDRSWSVEDSDDSDDRSWSSEDSDDFDDDFDDRSWSSEDSDDFDDSDDRSWSREDRRGGRGGRGGRGRGGRGGRGGPPGGGRGGPPGGGRGGPPGGGPPIG